MDRFEVYLVNLTVEILLKEKVGPIRSFVKPDRNFRAESPGVRERGKENFGGKKGEGKEKKTLALKSLRSCDKIATVIYNVVMLYT